MVPIINEIQCHDLKNKGFEGWYIRIQDVQLSIAVIIGIHTEKDKNKAFIQTLDSISHASQFVYFEENEISYQREPFEIKLGDNCFNTQGLKLFLKNSMISISARLSFSDFKPLKSTRYAPTIMGPFAYLSYMECVHAIISLSHKVKGNIMIQNKEFTVNGISYIEKDWGTSFPERYIWFQSNDCVELNATLFFAVANIPLKQICFQGIIAVLAYNDKQYRFATYNGCRLKRIFQKDGHCYIIAEQYPYRLYFKIKQGTKFYLKAPVNGTMGAHVDESLNASITLHLYKHHKSIAKLHFKNCGCEISNIFE